MRRRAFLAALLGATADPERLLWVPGRKLISIPTAVNLDADWVAWKSLRQMGDQVVLSRIIWSIGGQDRNR